MRTWRALERARALNLGAAGTAAARFGPDGISRRRLLAALGAGLAASVLPACAFDRAPRVAIVGGGLAGLSALHRLRAAGVDATLFEARNAAGGRTRSVRGVFAEDYAFDEGGQLVNSDHADLRRLVGELGLRLVDRRGFGAAQELQLGTDGEVPEAELARALRGIAEQITADSDRLDADYAGVAAQIDAMSVADYLDRHGLEPGVARSAIEAGIRTEYGAEPEEASALELLFNLPTVDGERLTRLSFSDERFLVEGGAGQVAERLAERHAGSIRLGRRLTEVEFDDAGVRLVFADGASDSFDQVVLAVPAPLLREIAIEGPLSQAWRDLIAEVRLGRNEKLIAGYDRDNWRQKMGFGGALWGSEDFAAAWDAASVPPSGAAGPGALTFFLGGDQVEDARGASARDLAGRFTASARAAIPGLSANNGRLRRTRWCDDPLTRGSYASFRPGQLTRFGGLLTVEEAGAARPSRAGPLLFAGEWLSDAWPGYMNGAVQTGRIAADSILAPAARRAA
jgi:monoamine oxidase